MHNYFSSILKHDIKDITMFCLFLVCLIYVLYILQTHVDMIVKMAADFQTVAVNANAPNLGLGWTVVYRSMK